MIEKLYSTPDMDKYENIYGTNPPSNSQIINKINELIDKINELDVKVSNFSARTQVFR